MCDKEISVKAAAECFFVKGQSAVAMLTDVFLPCVSDADLLYRKTFNEWRPYVISLYCLVIPYNVFMQSWLVTQFVHGVDNHSVGLINIHCKPDLLPFQNHMRLKIEKVRSEKVENSSKFKINLSEF